MNFKKLSKLSLLAIVAICSSCSVIMAAKKEGTTIENIQYSCTRGQILSQGPVVISSEKTPSGELVEVYQFQKQKGAPDRAFLHGVLDITTCGLWEVIGTPMEAIIEHKEYFSLRVTYDECENISKIELM